MSVDPLFDRLVEKLDAEAFPAGTPVDAPLAGIDDAIAVMEVVAEQTISAEKRSVAFPFFAKDGACLTAPFPLRIDWWESVRAWQANGQKRIREIESTFGNEAGDTWANEESDECYNNLRAAIHGAWESKHPKLSGGWNEECTSYVIKI